MRIRPSWVKYCVACGLVLTAIALFAVAHKALAEEERNASFEQNPSAHFCSLESENDAALDDDTDRDLLSNAEERLLRTDPFCADTDRDGFIDSIDDAPLSQAYVDWGNPRFTEGSTYFYPGPNWWLGAFRIGGAWVLEPPTSYVSSQAGGGAYMLVDAALAGSNLVLQVDFLDEEGSALFVDLVDASGVVIVGDLFGNLVQGSGELLRLCLPVEIPPDAPNPIAVGLRTGDGLIAVYESLLYVHRGSAVSMPGGEVPPDRSPAALRQAATIDPGSNTLRPQSRVDAPERSPTSSQATTVQQRAASGGNSGIIYVDQSIGNDTFTGLRRARGTGDAGPKKTINAGLRAARPGWTVQVAPGTYKENVRVSGVRVRIHGRVVIR